MALILDKWVELRGSGKLTPDERKTLLAQVLMGEKAPRLYRGANMSVKESDFPLGRPVDLGPSSSSEEEGSALPYAEGGDEQPVLFVIDGAKGLNVQDRAERVSGFAEQEWVVGGRYYVRGARRDEDGVLVVNISPTLGSDPVSQKNGVGKPITLDSAPSEVEPDAKPKYDPGREQSLRTLAEGLTWSSGRKKAPQTFADVTDQELDTLILAYDGRARIKNDPNDISDEVAAALRDVRTKRQGGASSNYADLMKKKHPEEFGLGGTDGTVPEGAGPDLAGPGGGPDPSPELPGPVVEQGPGGDDGVPDHVRSFVGPGDKVYRHPQGSYIVASASGAVAKIGPDGKPRKTSATAAKLAVGHGQWTPVSMSKPAPVKKPTALPLETKPLTDFPPAQAVVVSAAVEEEVKSAPAPTGSKFQVPMTFNEAPVSDVPKYIEDPNFHFQQKVDGIRGQLVIEPGKKPWFRSKSGQALVNSSAAKVTGPMLAKLGQQSDYSGPSYTVDGELLDGKWYVFDVAVDGGEKTPWEDRMRTAEAWVGEMHKLGLKNIQALPVARTAVEKRKLWEAVNASGGEGVMMKRKDAPYNYGSRVSHTLKAKITSTADVVVMERNIGGKENARIGVMIDGVLTPIGTVSMQGKEKNGAVNVGDVIEVEYLWANPANNNLQQPRMVKRRPDKVAADSTTDQFRYVGKDVVDAT